MDKIDKEIIKNLKDQEPSNQYKSMIKDTINQINSGEIERDMPKKNYGFIKAFQAVAAVFIVGILSVTVYAGVTGKIDFNIGKTGNKKIDKNYSEVAQKLEQSFETDEVKIDFISMAADPAYIVMEYDITLKEEAIKKLDGDIYYFGEGEVIFSGYGIMPFDTVYVNGVQRDNLGYNTLSIQKLEDYKYKIIDIINIADIKANELHIEKYFELVDVYTSQTESEMFNIDKTMAFDVTFDNKNPNILAETELDNGNILYIEEVSNSKFENYIVARIKGKVVTLEEYNNREKEFMIEDPKFAICDENGNHINYETITLGNYFLKVNDDESEENILGYEDYEELTDDQLVRTEEVQLLRLGFEEDVTPESLEIIPINRKLYNDRTDDEETHYLNDTWYPVEIGEIEISEELEGLGKVIITKIDETENGISFNYDLEGFAPSDIDLVVRVKDSDMNYYYPGKYMLKNIDSNTENMLFYPYDVYYLAGMPLLGYEELNVQDLEFAIFYNTEYDKLSDVIEFEWPDESSEIGSIENIEIW